MYQLLDPKAFQPAFITARNLDEGWFKLLVELSEKFRIQDIDAGSFEGGETNRVEFDWAGGVIYHPLVYTEAGVRLPLAPTVPAGCSVPTTDASIEEYFRDKLMEGNPAPNEHYSYGWFLRGLKQGPAWLTERNHRYILATDEEVLEVIDPGGLHITFTTRDNPQIGELLHGVQEENKPYDQVHWAIEYLKRFPFSNHTCMQVGFPQNLLVYDWSYENEEQRGTTPCLRVVDLKAIKHGPHIFLNMYVYFRSWDLYSAWSENMGGLALLLEYICVMASTDKMAFNPGALCFASKGLHCYSHAISELEKRAGCSIQALLAEKQSKLS